MDSPVSGTGGGQGAESGELTLLVGASHKLFERHLPLLQDIGKEIYLLGPMGSGHVAKALNNLLVATEMIATAEVVVVAMKQGMDPYALVAAIQNSSGRNFCTEHRFPHYILKGDFSPASGGAFYLLEKDCAQAVAFGRSLGVSMPSGNLVTEIVRIAATVSGRTLPLLPDVEFRHGGDTVSRDG